MCNFIYFAEILSAKVICFQNVAQLVNGKTLAE